MVFRSISLAILTLVILAPRIAFSQSCELVQNQNFNAYSGDWQNYSKSMMEKDFGPSTGLVKCLEGGDKANENNCTSKKTTKVGEGVLRAFFPKGQILGWASGFTWINPIKPSKATIMEYRVKFEKGFEWTKGGKLPGLCGGGQCVAGCTDHQNQQKNFSTRLMWHQDGTMIAYPYWPENTSRCGGNWYWMDPQKPANKLELKSDVWYTIRQELELGQANQKNSKMRIYVDDNLVLERNNIKLITEADATIRFAYWTNYVGGSSVSSFAPKKDQYIFFDDFKVWVDCPSKKMVSLPIRRQAGAGSTHGPDFHYSLRDGKLSIPAQSEWVSMTVFTAQGKILGSYSAGNTEVGLHLVSNKLYFIHRRHANGFETTEKLIGI